MIITPNCQIAIDYQNSFVDRGNAGIVWDNFVGTVAYEDSLFGRGWDIPTSGTLPKLRSSTQLNNPCDIDSEYSLMFRINRVNDSQISRFFSGGALLNPARGIGVQLENTGAITLNVDRDRSNLLLGTGWKIVGLVKYTTKYELYIFDVATKTWEFETINISRTITWSNRYWRLNNISFNTNDSSLAGDAYALTTWDAFYLWNTILEFDEIQRAALDMHPLKG